MVDIHSHILPGVDDGARTFEEAIAMIESAAAGGTTTIIATPHANSVFTFDEATTKRLAAELQERAGDRIRIGYGCELHLSFDNVADAVRYPSKYAIQGGKYLLAEISDYAVPATMLPAFRALGEAGLRPILVHPERNAIVRASIEALRPLVEAGVLLQVSGFAVGDRLVRRLIEAGLVFAVASDAHDPVRRGPDLSGAYRTVAAEFGAETAERLFRENPSAVLSGASG